MISVVLYFCEWICWVIRSKGERISRLEKELAKLRFRILEIEVFRQQIRRNDVAR